jgi:predicted small secreted protein
MLRIYAVIVLVAVSVFMLSACNTVQGMGRDISSAGDAIVGLGQ